MARKKPLQLVTAEKETQLQEHTTPWGKVWTAGADVQKTWRAYGWTPPSEYRTDFLFAVNRAGGYMQ